MQIPRIFYLIDNFSESTQKDLCEYILCDIECLNSYYKLFNVYTYAAQFNNGSLQYIVDLYNRLTDDCIIDVQTRDLYGDNALHVSCKKGRYENAKFLLENNFDPDALNFDKKTPVILTVESKHRYVMNFVYLFTHYGADLNLCYFIEKAILLKNEPLVLFLLQKKVDLSDFVKKIISKDEKYFKYVLRYYKKSKKNKDLESLMELYRESTLLDNTSSSSYFYNAILRYNFN